MARTVDLETFVVEHEGRLLRTAYLLTGDRRSAEELLAEALVSTHRRPPWPGRSRWGPDGDPVAAVRRAMVRALERREGQQVSDRPVGAAWCPDDAGLLPDRGTEELRRALLDLPPRTRAALVLRLHDALPEAETAEVLGCSAGAVAALTEEARAAVHGLCLARPAAPVAAAPTSRPAASPEPDDDAIYRRRT
jgi:DNA-directed RNA polymerase specialized sigma24 family protein